MCLTEQVYVPSLVLSSVACDVFTEIIYPSRSAGCGHLGRAGIGGRRLPGGGDEGKGGWGGGRAGGAGGVGYLAHGCGQRILLN